MSLHMACDQLLAFLRSYTESLFITCKALPSSRLAAGFKVECVLLAGQDSFLLEALFRNEAWGHMLAPISEANERAVYQSMLEGCQAALDGCAAVPHFFPSHCLACLRAYSQACVHRFPIAQEAAAFLSFAARRRPKALD